MDNRTKVSTVVAILAYIATWVKMLWDIDLHLDGDTISAIAVLIVAGVSWANSHWFNQNFTETACKYTGEMRAEKERQKEES